MALKLVDSHCHLDSAKFSKDRDKVIQAAQEAGLVLIINPAGSLSSSQEAVALAEKYPMVYATVGVHPHNAKHYTHRTAAELARLAEHPKVVAIGEIGLDFFRNLSPQDAQRRAFSAQLDLAAELGLPDVIHDRDATQDTYATLHQWVNDGKKRRGVMHSYSAGPQWLDRFLELGFYISISGPVTFPKATTLQQAAKRVPLDRLMIETDAPYLTPQPHRGRRNQPAHVQYVAEKIASLRNLPLQRVCEATTRNVFDFFAIQQAK